MRELEWDALCWKDSQALEALSQLAVAARLIPHASIENPPGETDSSSIEWAARRLGCEVDPVNVSLCDLEGELSRACPSFVRIRESHYLAVLQANTRHLLVLTPGLKRQRVLLTEVARAIRQQYSGTSNNDFENLLREAGLDRRALHKSLLLFDETPAHGRWNGCWILRRSPGSPPLPLLRELGALQNGVGLLTAHIIQYALLIISWALLGSFSFSGRVDRVWLWAWALLLFTLLPFQVLTTWLQGLFSIGLGAFLKRRLLFGALKLTPEEVRHAGVGTFLGQALEAEAIERLALTGAIPGLLAAVEIILAMLFLGKLAMVLALFCAIPLWAATRFLKRYERWTETRLQITHDLVEAMVGHRTRLVQQSPAEWHESEDQSLHKYLLDSQKLDRSGTILVAALPRLWLVLAIAALAPSVVYRSGSPEQTAVQLGGMLLAYTALRRWTGSFAGIAAAYVAGKRIAPLFRAAAKPETVGEMPASHLMSQTGKVLEAERVTFRYRSSGPAAVRECSLVVHCGDRILLEGASGGGKTTFASLLTGIRRPESGLLLANGLDWQTLGGSGWRRVVAGAPQFHENHLLAETLAFNLLMARHWPASEADLEEAERVCRELGLGTLIDSMPSGLMQMVGEGGWQLSHGEKSRVFMARALLQNAEAIILDESFAALDPENAKLALDCAIRRAPALIVIAHP